MFVQEHAPTVAANVTVQEAEVSSQTKPEEEAEMEMKKMESSESEVSSDEETKDMLASRRYDLCVAKCTYVRIQVTRGRIRTSLVCYPNILCSLYNGILDISVLHSMSECLHFCRTPLAI